MTTSSGSARRQMELGQYKHEISKLLKKTTLDYPFYDKTNEQLVADAIERARTQTEFAILKVGSIDSTYVPLHGEQHLKTTLALNALNSERNPGKIKLSSFMYPCILPGVLKEIYSTINNKRIASYKGLYSKLEELKYSVVLVTTSWQALNNFATYSECINIVPLPEGYDKGEIIRKEFTEARRELLNELLVTPAKHFECGVLNQNLVLEALREYEPEIRRRLNLLPN